jgi:hypothetical protein
MKFGLGLGVFALCAAFCYPANAQSNASSGTSTPLNLNPPGISLHFADHYHLLPTEVDLNAIIDAGSLAQPDANSSHEGKAGNGRGEVRPPRIQDVPPWEVTGMCDAGKLDRKACQFHWWPAFREQTQYLFIETGWNLATNTHVWEATTHGHWFQNWMDSVEGFKFSRWNDANPISDDYVGHPMMGAISMDIFIQNYPRGMSVEAQNTKEYWHSRLWGLLWATIYSTQWKLGPISEASFGNTGKDTSFDKNAGHKTNGTGTVGLVITPVGGWIWTLGEDFVDMHLLRFADQKTTNPLLLFGMGFANPCRSFANLMRFKAPWYRDSRPVRPHREWPTMTDLQAAP